MGIEWKESKSDDWKERFESSKEGKDLMEKMLAWNPMKRISVLEALTHPYFKIGGGEGFV